MLKILKDWWGLALALIVSASIQLSFIGKSSVWHDEGYSLWLVKYNYLEIIGRTARDVHPPLYYLLLKAWGGVFGQGVVAARSLSVAAILGCIVLSYLLIKQLFGSIPARWAALILAVAPFLIRYGQEARMYGLVALLLTAATYVLAVAFKGRRLNLLYVYALLMALAFYTHYYAIFMLAVHWAYVLLLSYSAGKFELNRAIFNKHWWGSNFLIALLFAPWLPAAYGQFTRVQGGFWIPPVDSATIPHTLATWMHYDNHAAWPLWLKMGLLALLGTLSVWAVWRNSSQRKPLALLIGWAYLTPLAVWAISRLSRPVYIDRYFVFAAIGFYLLITLLWFVKPLDRLYRIRPLVLTGLILLFVMGVRNVYMQSNHQMSQIGAIVNQQASSEDAVVAGELYVYLDFSYYHKRTNPALLYAPGGVSGYGETSLFYDQPSLLVRDWSQLKPASQTIWVVGKQGEKPYLKNIPSHWRLTQTHQAKETVLYRYVLSN